MGRWFELAKMLDSLHAVGVSSTDIYEQAGITPLDQNSWKVQAAVYVSLEATPDFPKARTRCAAAAAGGGAGLAAAALGAAPGAGG